MNKMLATAVLGFSLLAAGTPALAADTAATKTVRSFIDTVFNQHKVAAAFEKYVGPTYTQHNPQVPDGKEGSAGGLDWLVSNNPGIKASIKRTITEGDLVAIHYSLTMKEGDRGSAIVDIFRLQNGKIVEHWDVVQQVPAEAKNSNTMF